MGSRRLRALAAAAGTVFILAAACPAFALTYTDPENGLSLEIPEQDGTYYFTPEESNLFADLQEQIDNSGRNVRLLVSTYDPAGTLGYSLQVAADPLPGDEAPAAGTADAGTVFRDIQLLDEEERSELTRAVRSAYQGRFSCSEPEDTELHGLPALRISGTGVADSGWGAYDAQIYLIATENSILTIALLMQDDPGSAYRAEGEALLQTLRLGPDTAPTETPVRTEEPPAQTQAPDPVPVTEAPHEDEGVPSPTPEPENPLLAWIAHMWAQQRIFLLGLAAGLVALVALIIALSLNYRHRREKAKAKNTRGHDSTVKRDAQQTRENPQHFPAPDAPSSDRAGDTRVHKPASKANLSAPAGASGDTILESSAAAQRTDSAQQEKDNEDDIMTSNEAFAGKDYDYTEDISKYTQQPSADVNDVSRYTQGYGADANDGLHSLQDTPAEPVRTPRPSVGSRVARNRSRRKKK